VRKRIPATVGHVWNRDAGQPQGAGRKRIVSGAETEGGRYRTASLVKISPVQFDGARRQGSINHVIPAIITTAVCCTHPERGGGVGAAKLIKRRTTCRGNLIRIDGSVGLIINPGTVPGAKIISKVKQV